MGSIRRRCDPREHRLRSPLGRSVAHHADGRHETRLAAAEPLKDLLTPGLAPMIILARPFVHPSIALAMYTLAVRFALDTDRHAVAGAPPLVVKPSERWNRLRESWRRDGR